MTNWTPLIAAHATAASLALFLGPVNLFRRVRGDLMHRIIGFVWIGSIYFVCLSSFAIQRLNPGHYSWIHLLSILTLATVTIGLVAAIRHNVPLHRGNMIGTYCGLIGAFIGVVVVPKRLIPQMFQHNPAELFSLAALILVVATAICYAAYRLGNKYPMKKARSR